MGFKGSFDTPKKHKLLGLLGTFLEPWRSGVGSVGDSLSRVVDVKVAILM